MDGLGIGDLYGSGSTVWCAPQCHEQRGPRPATMAATALRVAGEGDGWAFRGGVSGRAEWMALAFRMWLREGAGGSGPGPGSRWAIMALRPGVVGEMVGDVSWEAGMR